METDRKWVICLPFKIVGELSEVAKGLTLCKEVDKKTFKAGTQFYLMYACGTCNKCSIHHTYDNFIKALVDAVYGQLDVQCDRLGEDLLYDKAYDLLEYNLTLVKEYSLHIYRKDNSILNKSARLLKESLDLQITHLNDQVKALKQEKTKVHNLWHTN